MESSSSSSKVVPESAMEAVERTLANLKQVESHLLEFLSLANPDVLDEMPPLQRAQSLFMFAKATSTLFALRLRTSGIHPEKHPIKTELERLSLYQDKLEQFVDISKVTGVLSACAHSGSLKKGTEAHIYAIDNGLASGPHVTTALIDMYDKYGSIQQGLQVFYKSQVKNICCWNALISGLALHGHGYAALKPGETILGALLSACIVHQDLDVGERAVKLVSSRGNCLSDGELMMFSNLYASCGQWEEANKWREMMNAAGIVKTAGFSVVEVNGKFHKFLAG